MTRALEVAQPPASNSAGSCRACSNAATPDVSVVDALLDQELGHGEEMDQLAVAQPFGLFDQLAHAVPHPEQRRRLLLAGQRLAAATPPHIGFKDDVNQLNPPCSTPPHPSAGLDRRDGWARRTSCHPNWTAGPAVLPRETVRRSGDPTRRPDGGVPWPLGAGSCSPRHIRPADRSDARSDWTPCPAAGPRRRAGPRGAARSPPVPRCWASACPDRPP